MKRASFLTVIFCWMCISTSVLAATYDATGRWNYRTSGNWNNCQEPAEPNESGTAVLIQTENSFLLVVTSSTSGKLRTVSGTINGAVYKFTDKYLEDEGWNNDTVTFTLSSPSSGSGSGSWKWSGGGDSCSGGYSLSLTKQPQSPPSYNASGIWNFNQNSFWNNCGETNPASDVGTVTIQQSSNRISATDSKGSTWKGFVSGATYTFVDSYAEDDGISSDVCAVNLTSAAQGSGQCWWVWDLNGNSNDHCEGGSNISITKKKQPTNESTAMPWLPLLLFSDDHDQGIPSTILITDLPATDNDGKYTLQWSSTGLVSTPWLIEEDSNTNFMNPKNYLSYSNSYNFSNKTNGTYCYRVGFPNGPFSSPACVIVNIPVQPRQVTIHNQITANLNLQQVVQVKVSATNSFSRSDLLTVDPAYCLALPGEAINRGGSRTFNLTIGNNYYVFIGIGTWDMDNFSCSYLTPFFKRRYFTDSNFYTYYVYTIVSVAGHTSGNWDWYISGSYLNGSLAIVPLGDDPIYFTITKNNPIP